MHVHRWGTIAVVASLLGACTVPADSPWPVLAGDDPSTSGSERIDIPPSPAEQADAMAAAPVAPAPGSNAADPSAPAFPAPLVSAPASPAPMASATAVPETGTYVGRQVRQLWGDVDSVRGSILDHNRALQSARDQSTVASEEYYGITAAITTRLQQGTTPGNPVLEDQWRQAQSALERINTQTTGLDQLSRDAAATASRAAYVRDQTRATFAVSGAVEEDHRQLRLIEDSLSEVMVQVERLLDEVSDDLARQMTTISDERRNLAMLSASIKTGELYGASLASLTRGPFDDVEPRRVAQSRDPLVVIRFAREDVAYQQPLYKAMAAALERKPDATFSLVAVAPATGGAAQVAIAQTKSKRNAQDVLRSLADMGLPASRVALSSTTEDVSSNEVRIYVR